MKLRNLAIATLLFTFGTAAIIYTPILLRQGRVRHLLQTQQCIGCDLQNVNLAGLDLRGVNLEGANLKNADLTRTQLANANLKQANLEGADLEQADLGCTAISFNVEADPDRSDLNLSVESSPNPTRRSNDNTILGLNVKTKTNGATLNLNLGGCADLEDASLSGATMPDGSVYLETADRPSSSN
jgi:uncharacterized protein YjbI with pentapeptide repeats